MYFMKKLSILVILLSLSFTNYAQKNFTVYNIVKNDSTIRFKVYFDYKLKLKAYSKKRFDPFCRWERITIPYKNNVSMQTTIGQLNFFKWALENGVIDYIGANYSDIENDMNICYNSIGCCMVFSFKSVFERI